MTSSVRTTKHAPHAFVRDLIGRVPGLGGAAAWPVTVCAQQPTLTPEFGLLYPRPADAAAARAKIVWERLGEGGYVEGNNLTLVSRAADSRPDLTSKFASDLAQRNVRVARGPRCPSGYQDDTHRRTGSRNRPRCDRTDCKSRPTGRQCDWAIF